MNALVKRTIPKSTRHTLRHTERTVRHGVTRAALRALRWVPNGHEDLGAVLLETGPLTPDRVIRGYAQGYFPSPIHDGPMRWHAPDPRAIMVLEEVHIPRRMRSYLNSSPYEIRFDTAFSAVQDACAVPAAGRETTFITPELRDVFLELHRMGFAHSVETYQAGTLVGGLYGVSLSGYFSISSMFHTADNASKIALLSLVETLRRNQFELLDVWWMQPHFAQLGAREIPRGEFLSRLAHALIAPTCFRIPQEPIAVDYHQYR